MKNFTFTGSTGLVVRIDLKLCCFNLLSEPQKIKIYSNKI